MSQPDTPFETSPSSDPPAQPAGPQPSYVKLAMRNMVRKRGTSLFHFALTTFGLVSTLVALACIDHYLHP